MRREHRGRLGIAEGREPILEDPVREAVDGEDLEARQGGTQPSEQDDGAILEVIQKGYRLGDRVLRPARVVISQEAPEA